MPLCGEEKARMPAGSEFHDTEEAATLKLRNAKVVWTRGTDNRVQDSETACVTLNYDRPKL